jgi:hypothetical protein
MNLNERLLKPDPTFSGALYPPQSPRYVRIRPLCYSSILLVLFLSYLCSTLLVDRSWVPRQLFSRSGWLTYFQY